jgi:hypothetical protein
LSVTYLRKESLFLSIRNKVNESHLFSSFRVAFEVAEPEVSVVRKRNSSESSKDQVSNDRGVFEGELVVKGGESSAVGDGSLCVHPIWISNKSVLEYVLENRCLGAAHEECGILGKALVSSGIR